MPSFTASNVSALLWGPTDSSNGKDAVGFRSVGFLWIRSAWNLFWDVFFSLTSTQLGQKLARFLFVLFFFFFLQDPEHHNMQFLISVTSSSTCRAAVGCACLITKQNSRSIALLIGLKKTSVFFLAPFFSGRRPTVYNCSKKASP